MNVHYRLNFLRPLIASTVLAVTLSACGSSRSLFKSASHAEQARDYETALSEYKAALDKDPNNIDYRMRYEKSRINAAFDHFEKGRRAFASDDLDTAKTELTRSLELDPTNDMAQEQLERIKAVELSRTRKQPEPERTVEQLKQDYHTDPTFQSQMDPKFAGTFSVKMTQDSKAVFESLADTAGFTVVFDPDFRGTPVPVDLKSVDIFQALDIVCMQTNSFWQPITRTTILVAQDNQTKRRQYEQQILKTVYLSNSVTATEITEAITALRTILNMRYIAQITAMNAIILRDTPDKIAIAERILDDVDKAKPEVIVEAMILEVDRSVSQTLGVNPPTSLSTTFNGTPQTTTTTTTDSTGATTTTTTPTTTSTTTNNNVTLNRLDKIGTGSFSVAIPSISAQAIAGNSNARLLQNPRVRATDGKLASIHVGSKVPVPSGSFQPAFVGATGTPVVQFVYQDIGVNLDITPRVMLNHEVSLTVVIQVSALAGTQNAGGLQLPVFTNRTINHEIRLAEGETNVLGGIITRNESTSMSGLPWLKDIPILKYFFGQEAKERDQTEIVVMLTPHIVRMPHITAENLEGVYIGTEVATRMRVPAAMPPMNPPKAPADAAGAPTPAPATPARPLPTGVTIGTPVTPAAPAKEPRPTSATLVFNPSPLTLTDAQPSPINIAITGNDIFAADLTLSFDPNAVKIQDIRDGGFLSRNGQDIVAIVRRIESDKGLAHISIERPPGSAPISGNGPIITLMVQPGARKGDSLLKIVDFQLRDPQQNVQFGKPAETKVTIP